MTPQQLIGLAFRVAALWLPLTALQLYASQSALLDALADEPSLFWRAFACVPLALALLFWMFPMRLAHQLLPSRSGDATAEAPLQDTMAAMAIVLGLYTAVTAIPDLGVAVMIFSTGIDFLMGNYSFPGSASGPLYSHLLQLGLGIGLLRLARPLADRIFPRHSGAPL